MQCVFLLWSTHVQSKTSEQRNLTFTLEMWTWLEMFFFLSEEHLQLDTCLPYEQSKSAFELAHLSVHSSVLH